MIELRRGVVVQPVPKASVHLRVREQSNDLLQISTDHLPNHTPTTLQLVSYDNDQMSRLFLGRFY